MFVPPAMHHPWTAAMVGLTESCSLAQVAANGPIRCWSAALSHTRAPVAARAWAVVAPVELVARTERRALGVEEDDPHVPVALRGVELVPQLVAQRRGDRVVLLGAAQREPAHRAIVGGPNCSPHRAECRDGRSSRTSKSSREVRAAPVRLDP